MHMGLRSGGKRDFTVRRGGKEFGPVGVTQPETLEHLIEKLEIAVKIVKGLNEKDPKNPATVLTRNSEMDQGNIMEPGNISVYIQRPGKAGLVNRVMIRGDKQDGFGVIYQDEEEDGGGWYLVGPLFSGVTAEKVEQGLASSRLYPANQEGFMEVKLPLEH